MKLKTNIKPTGAGIEVVPLVDVILLLLFFFMLSSSFVSQPGIKVTLPKGTTDGGVRNAQVILTVIQSDPPVYFYNDQVVNMEQMIEKLKYLADTVPGTVVVIRADQNVTHGVVANLMQKVMQQNLNVLLATQR
jgi:biopolymer transport protein ExbD